MKNKVPLRPLLRVAGGLDPRASRHDAGAPRRRAEPEGPAAAGGDAVAWRPCPHCWGQRRILEYRPAPNGEGRLAAFAPCDCCMGIGEVLR